MLNGLHHLSPLLGAIAGLLATALGVGAVWGVAWLVASTAWPIVSWLVFGGLILFTLGIGVLSLARRL